MTKARTSAQFRNQVLDIMAQKDHWAWPQFVGPSISKTQLKIHYQQEYAVYVRDFPVFLSRIHSKNPPLAVRKMLAENIFEEDTGHLSLGVSHPDLFLTMMKGLGFPKKNFDQIVLLPATSCYRRWLDRMADHPDWVVGAAVMTIFVEGSVHDRKELASPARPKTPKQISEKISRHPLVLFHGVAPQALDLIRAHQLVEGGHRHDAYAMVMDYAKTRAQQDTILTTLQRTLNLWLSYRDGVARACGLHPINA
jgi:pyrroloquinoline-quinone synthase